MSQNNEMAVILRPKGIPWDFSFILIQTFPIVLALQYQKSKRAVVVVVVLFRYISYFILKSTSDSPEIHGSLNSK